jgi:DNA invertase Pin-like site-specific DNA recombinase
MTTYGYARVSTKRQSFLPQREPLKAAGAEVITTERASGTLTDRPKLDSLLNRLKPGDKLVVVSLDRLGRSLQHLIAVIDDLNDRGVEFQSLREQIDTATAGGRLQMQIFGALAEFEASLISERTKAGLAAAREAGRVGGRPRAMDLAKIEAALALRAQGHSFGQIAEALGVSKTTVQRTLKPLLV